MIFLSILLAIVPFVAQLASATESMRIPANKNETMNIFPMQQNAPVHDIQKRANGRVNSAYYVNCKHSPSFSRTQLTNVLVRGYLRRAWELLPAGYRDKGSHSYVLYT